MLLSLVLLAAVDAGRTSASVSPVDQVLSLLRTMEHDVQKEGRRESARYNKFACFCRTQTNRKVASIQRRERAKARLEGEIKSLNGQAAELNFDIEKLTADYGQMEAELAKATKIRDEENAIYQEVYADLTKAVTALGSALSSISGSKGSFLEQKEKVVESLKIADALGKAPKTKVALSLLQEGEVPESDYDFHSDGIISTLTDLQTDFTAQKTKVQNEENAAATAFSNAASAKRTAISTAKSTVTTDTNTLKSTDASIATKTGELTENNANLADDNTYLKDLTGQCEHKAREWDQRSKTRSDELTALGEGIRIISGQVKPNDAASGSGGRSLLTVEPDSDDDVVDDAQDYADVVFVQKAVRKAKKARVVHTESRERSKAVTMIRSEAEKLQSVELSMLAMRMAADPFAKVKTLIQQLIERLLKESADEATQKGWCDTALAKANTDRDYRQGDLDELTAEINEGLAQKAALEEEHSTLTDEISELNQAHHDATVTRNSEKTENKDTLEHAQTGLDALKNAIQVLEDFYKNAAKGGPTVALVETSASPVDADAPKHGRSIGAYKGNQAQAGGILGMLATIKSDFERTISQTEEAEAAAAAAYTKFDRETKASISSKETGLARNNEETVETTGDLQANLQSLQSNQDLLDEALRSLTILRPQCIDTKMSYAERVARREAEVVALKKAVCVLDQGDDEVSECSGDWARYAPRGRGRF